MYLLPPPRIFKSSDGPAFMQGRQKNFLHAWKRYQVPTKSLEFVTWISTYVLSFCRSREYLDHQDLNILVMTKIFWIMPKIILIFLQTLKRFFRLIEGNGNYMTQDFFSFLSFMSTYQKRKYIGLSFFPTLCKKASIHCKCMVRSFHHKVEKI